MTESCHELLAIRETYFKILHQIQHYLKWACPLVLGNLKDYLIFIVFCLSRKFLFYFKWWSCCFAIWLARSNLSREDISERVVLRQWLASILSLLVTFQGLTILPDCCLVLFSKISLKKSLNEEWHHNTSLFHVYVIRSWLASGLNLLCRKDTNTGNIWDGGL